ncbi:transcription activator GAGA-like isoform X1 [Prorops nasuta]|uniref:transcription activator GAGA-like isoform X1 n=1 Tax=Prorops nasuta TaxID=863751 RepID=UPI0034CE4BC7
MGSSSQLYSLSWGEFSSSLASAVQLLRGHGDLVDVTLAAGGRSFPAHKIVLCAASPFLLDLLKSTPCQHPVVMLAGVEADDLELLLEFVYRGEVSVEPSQLPSLLQAAHCLSIHGLTPPTILTENGEEVPVSAIPATNDSFNKETANSCLPIRRRKKRRKSTCGKWQRAVGAAEVEHKEMEIDDSRTRYQKEEEATNHSDSADRSELLNHRSCHSPASQQAEPVVAENSQLSQEVSDSEPNLHTLLPMQQYSPLHIPQFPGSLNATFSGSPLMGNSTSTSGASLGQLNSTKIRGASDCPGICPLCGATLRQARNLRRHLLSSCKYRFNSSANQNSATDPMMIEIKPEVELPGYTGQSNSYGADGANNCEQIVCKPSPLPSPTLQTSNVSPHSNIPSPIAR